jgi:hypothetical protein
MKLTEWQDRFDIILSRAKLLDDIYGQSEDAQGDFLPRQSVGIENFNWFWNRKVPLYNIKLVRVAFLTKESLEWMGRVRAVELGGSRKGEILKLDMI